MYGVREGWQEQWRKTYRRSEVIAGFLEQFLALRNSHIHSQSTVHLVEGLQNLEVTFAMSTLEALPALLNNGC